jgi:hypothetical protein
MFGRFRSHEQIKRNTGRFPSDFVFRLKPGEASILEPPSPVLPHPDNRSQFATGSQRHRDPRLPPWAFTEHGAIMAATVLNSPRAVQMSLARPLPENPPGAPSPASPATDKTGRSRR